MEIQENDLKRANSYPIPDQGSEGDPGVINLDERRQENDLCEVLCFDEEKVSRLKSELVPMSGLADLFKLLADETRVKILYILSKEELCVCDISAVLGSTVSNVSHHLRALRTARLVKSRRDGKQVFYALDDEHVVNLIREAFDHVGHTRE